MSYTSFGPEQEQQFFETGYLRLGQVVSDSEIQALCDRIDEIMLGQVRYDGMLMQLDSTTGNYKDVPAIREHSKPPHWPTVGSTNSGAIPCS